MSRLLPSLHVSEGREAPRLYGARSLPPRPRGICLPKPVMNFWLIQEPKAVPCAATFVGLPCSASQGVSLCLPHLNEGTGGTITANDSAFGIWIIN